MSGTEHMSEEQERCLFLRLLIDLAPVALETLAVDKHTNLGRLIASYAGTAGARRRDLDVQGILTALGEVTSPYRKVVQNKVHSTKLVDLLEDSRLDPDNLVSEMRQMREQIGDLRESVLRVTTKISYPCRKDIPESEQERQTALLLAALKKVDGLLPPIPKKSLVSDLQLKPKTQKASKCYEEPIRRLMVAIGQEYASPRKYKKGLVLRAIQTDGPVLTESTWVGLVGGRSMSVYYIIPWLQEELEHLKDIWREQELLKPSEKEAPDA